ncbi:hypothetical protein WG906_04475 [Pedobacter sp. P351]|uniref:hypothetical protein n=1 Tax=Pedobacter superstes TaxID=3133441 RepID=UPI0030A60E52
MTLYEFNKLNEYEQAESIWQSQFIADRPCGDSTILLYFLGEFFVEVILNTKLNKITGIKPFKTTGLLEPYWESVSLAEIEDLL